MYFNIAYICIKKTISLKKCIYLYFLTDEFCIKKKKNRNLSIGEGGKTIRLTSISFEVKSLCRWRKRTIQDWINIYFYFKPTIVFLCRRLGLWWCTSYISRVENWPNYLFGVHDVISSAVYDLISRNLIFIRFLMYGRRVTGRLTSKSLHPLSLKSPTRMICLQE